MKQSRARFSVAHRRARYAMFKDNRHAARACEFELLD